VSNQLVLGSTNKGDCTVRVTECLEPRINIVTDNDHLFEMGLLSVIEESMSALGTDTLCVDLEDHGAVDYVVMARVEAAVRAVSPQIGAWRIGTKQDSSTRDRLRRTRLYAPGNNPHLLMGAELYGSDCVLLDLEDSVPLSEKNVARILVKHLLAAVEFQEVWVRINPLETCGREDLAEVMLASPHGICLPKAESCNDVFKLEEEMAVLESNLEIDLGSTFIMPIIETGKGVLNALEIASASKRVVVMAFGAEDYTRDVGANRTREALLYPRTKIVAACAASGIQASDTVYADVDDEEGLIEETKHIRDLGFVGKGAINPRQIRPIHEVFRPTDEQIKYAREVIAVADQAKAKGIGAVALRGKMIDWPVVERAKKLVAHLEQLEEKWR
jgi:citrate lyase subunit beta / citryl-CoA lyase